jgi:hypothetical protein
MNRLLNRRTILRGAGVALALPWLESLAPKAARAQAALRPKRFIPIYFPNGSAERFRPTGVGTGANWSLSPILEPFAELKSKMTVLTGMENWSAFNADSPSVEPSHGRQPGAYLSCVNGDLVSDQSGVDGSNSISVDQVIAQSPEYAAMPLSSMQVGASTWYSFCDGRACAYSRSISWKSATQPMYKEVDPLTIFNQIVGVIPPSNPGGTTPDPEKERQKALDKSVLDGVLESASRVRGQMGSADQLRMDEFLESVRTVEKRATAASTGMANLMCQQIDAPTLSATPEAFKINSADYDKGVHTDLINDLIVMAIQCDVTRVVSYMLEDERSEFIYSHVPRRIFNETGSTPGNGDTCGEYHGSQHAGSAVDDGFCTINWWQSVKVAELCAKLNAIPEGDGLTVLDNSLVLYGAAMHGSNHQCDDLPIALIGGASGTFVTDQHVQFNPFPNDRPMRDLYLTVLNHYFGLGVESFGVGLKGAPHQMITEIMA